MCGRWKSRPYHASIYMRTITDIVRSMNHEVHELLARVKKASIESRRASRLATELVMKSLDRIIRIEAEKENLTAQMRRSLSVLTEHSSIGCMRPAGRDSVEP